jgi:hypothetical protein
VNITYVFPANEEAVSKLPNSKKNVIPTIRFANVGMTNYMCLGDVLRQSHEKPGYNLFKSRGCRPYSRPGFMGVYSEATHFTHKSEKWYV